MERQKGYAGRFLKALIEKEQENIEFSLRLYEQVSLYIVTDCSSTNLPIG